MTISRSWNFAFTKAEKTLKGLILNISLYKVETQLIVKPTNSIAKWVEGEDPISAHNDHQKRICFVKTKLEYSIALN
jgi:hypothetical protein